MAHGSHVMTDEQYCPSASADLLHFPQTLLLKLCIADCKNFINDKNLWFKMGCDGECQPYIHPAAVAFNGRVDKFLYLCKRYDFIELAFDLCSRHSPNSAIQKDFLAP